MQLVSDRFVRGIVCIAFVLVPFCRKSVQQQATGEDGGGGFRRREPFRRLGQGASLHHKLGNCLLVELSVCPSVDAFVSLSVCPSVHLSVCPCVHLSFCPLVCQSVCPRLS